MRVRVSEAGSARPGLRAGKAWRARWRSGRLWPLLAGAVALSACSRTDSWLRGPLAPYVDWVPTQAECVQEDGGPRAIWHCVRALPGRIDTLLVSSDSQALWFLTIRRGETDAMARVFCNRVRHYVDVGALRRGCTADAYDLAFPDSVAGGLMGGRATARGEVREVRYWRVFSPWGESAVLCPVSEATAPGARRRAA